MTADLTIQVQLTKNEIYRALLLRSLRRWQFYACGVALIAVAYTSDRLAETGFRIFLSVIALLAYLLVIPYFAAKAVIRDPNVSALSLTFSNEGIASRGQSLSSNLQWALVKNVSEADGYIYIYLLGLGFWLIPRSQLTEPELNLLRDIFRQHLALHDVP